MAENTSKKPSAIKTTKRVTANRNFTGTTSGTRKKSSSAKTAKSNVSTAAKTVAATAATIGAVKIAKRAGGKAIATWLICFIVAIIIGASVCFFVGKNDRFDLTGDDMISISLGETYSDQGVEIVEFGIDLSKFAVVETDLSKNENGEYFASAPGDYYISYTVKSLKFGFIYPIQKIRLVSVIGASEGGE